MPRIFSFADDDEPLYTRAHPLSPFKRIMFELRTSLCPCFYACTWKISLQRAYVYIGGPYGSLMTHALYFTGKIRRERKNDRKASLRAIRARGLRYTDYMYARWFAHEGYLHTARLKWIENSACFKASGLVKISLARAFRLEVINPFTRCLCTVMGH